MKIGGQLKFFQPLIRLGTLVFNPYYTLSFCFKTQLGIIWLFISIKQYFSYPIIYKKRVKFNFCEEYF